MQHDQTRWPLATLILLADARSIAQKARLLRLAKNVAKERGIEL